MGRSSPFLRISFVFTRRDQIDFSLDKVQTVSEQASVTRPGTLHWHGAFGAWCMVLTMVEGHDHDYGRGSCSALRALQWHWQPGCSAPLISSCRLRTLSGDLQVCVPVFRAR